ncbi:hypothetical protein SETIT_2G208300v2 [Setaria italica]|uniref:C2H2-type domain-containing protein n=1 Tax=Setaria italica TaxID=4555 RepID=A0A368Q3C1_SETIT|nr:zinc finger RNA-binding protein [Setaria italica]RCV11710.1 hypothetical protein SETIT_2G208300v2 [Setaria italica]
MEFACRGRPAADQDGGDSRRRFPDPPPPHGDAMLVIRDALLLQLQKDRLRQEIIMTELATLERAMALSSAARHGIDAAYVEQPKPLFLSSEEFMPHHRWMEQFSVVNEVHDLKKNDVKHGNVQLKSVNPAAEDRFSVCLRPCCSNSKAEENEAFDEQKLQESNEPTKMSPSLKWELTGITIPVKKPKQPQSWSCVICQVETPDTEHNIKEHCAGKKHRSNVASLESRNKTIIQKAETTAESSSCAAQKTSSIIWSCSTCQANGTSEADLKEHLSGKTHQQNIEGQCQEGDGMTKNAEPQEAMCQESKLPQLSEKPPCTICQDNCTTKSELGSLLLAKIQTLLDAIDNMAMNSESHKAKSPPNNMPQHAEQTSQSNCSICQTGSTSQSNCNICQTGSGYQSCCSEPQSENPHKIRRRRKKRGALQVEGQDAEPGDMKLADKISSDGSCSKSASSEVKQASYLCEVCNLDLKSESRLADHCNGEEHLEKQKLLNFCEVCNLQCNSRKMLDHHRTGKKHQKNLDANK